MGKKFFKDKSKRAENIEEYSNEILYTVEQLSKYVGKSVNTIRCYFNWGIFEKHGLEPKYKKVYDSPKNKQIRTERKFTLQEMENIKNFLDTCEWGTITEARDEHFKKEKNKKGLFSS